MKQIFYVTLDPERALGVEDYIPSFHILYSENSQLEESIKDTGINIKKFEKSGNSAAFNTAKLLEEKNLQNYIKANSHGIQNILVFKNDKKIEEICNNLGYKLLNPSFEISKKFEDKIKFSEFVNSVEIFLQPKYEIFKKVSDLDYLKLSNLYGADFVVQFPFGHSGNSTFFIHKKDDLEELKAKYPLRFGRVMQMIKGTTYTINACITRLGVVIGGISEQITGIKELTPSEGGTIGNDFSQRHIDDYLRAELIKKTCDFGEVLRKEGHRGAFGLDFVFSEKDKEFYLIEANMRQVMSYGFASYLQRDKKIMPIMLWHFLELLDHDYNERFDCLNDQEEEWINDEIRKFRLTNDKLNYNILTNQPISASQVFFRNINSYSIKILEQFPTGIYRMRGRLPEESALLEGNEQGETESYAQIYPMREDGWSNLCLIKRGYNILEARNYNGFLITSMAEGAEIGSFGEIGRLQIMDSAFSSKSGSDLNGWIYDTIKVIKDNMRIEKL